MCVSLWRCWHVVCCGDGVEVWRFVVIVLKCCVLWWWCWRIAYCGDGVDVLCVVVMVLTCCVLWWWCWRVADSGDGVDVLQIVVTVLTCVLCIVGKVLTLGKEQRYKSAVYDILNTCTCSSVFSSPCHWGQYVGRCWRWGPVGRNTGSKHIYINEIEEKQEIIGYVVVLLFFLLFFWFCEVNNVIWGQRKMEYMAIKWGGSKHRRHKVKKKEFIECVVLLLFLLFFWSLARLIREYKNERRRGTEQNYINLASTKEYKGRTDCSSSTGPNEAVCVATLLLNI